MPIGVDSSNRNDWLVDFGCEPQRAIELVDKGTDMMLKSTIHDLYNEEMREKAYSSHHDQMTRPGDALFRQDCAEYSL